MTSAVDQVIRGSCTVESLEDKCSEREGTPTIEKLPQAKGLKVCI